MHTIQPNIYIRIILTFFLLVIPYINVFAFTLSEKQNTINSIEINLSGNFDDSSYTQLKDLIEINQNKQIVINADSPGGSADKIEDIMNIIHKHGNITWNVSFFDRCHSACAFAGISSNKISGKLGFHYIRSCDPLKNRCNQNSNIEYLYYKYHKYENEWIPNESLTQSVIDKIVSYGYNVDTINSLFNIKDDDIRYIRF